MPLTKSTGNMYQWVTHKHTHLGGECPHKCSYCYVQDIGTRFKQDRYKGELRLIEHELHVKYGGGRTIFVEHCNDLWAEAVPDEWVMAVLRHCREWPGNEYVFQTKNPERYRSWICMLPPRRILGCTIETTDAAIIADLSEAPNPWLRIGSMQCLRCCGERVFVTIEPILRGDMCRLAQWCANINPQFVNIGADSKRHGLPEPTAEDVAYLIRELKRLGVTIKEKHNLERLLNRSTNAGGMATTHDAQEGGG